MLMHYIYLQIKFVEKKLRLLLQNFNLIVCEVITLGKGTKHMCSSAHLLQWKACITTVGIKKYCCHQLGKPLPGSFYFSPGSLLHVLILNTIGFLDFELYVIDLYSAIDNVWRRQWQPTLVLSPGKSHGRGAWWALVHWVVKSRTRLSDFTLIFHFHALEKEMATHSSVLAWRIPGTEDPGGLLSVRLHRVGHDWSNLAAAAA